MNSQRELWNECLLAVELLTMGGPAQGQPEAEMQRRFSLAASFLDDSRLPGLFSGAETADPRLTRAHEALRDDLHRVGLTRVWELECQLAPVVKRLNRQGVLVDAGRLKQIQTDARQQADEAKLAFHAAVGTAVDLDSPKKILSALRAKGVDVPGTSEEHLLNCPPHLRTPLQEYRSAMTLARAVAGYLEAVGADGRLHAEYVQLGADSGRFACRNPNLQNVGRNRALRAAFIAAPGNYLVVADYSQVELRLAAFIAKETRMLRMFADGKDVHAETAALVLGKPVAAVSKHDRQLAKAVNFGLLYGQGAKGLGTYAATQYHVAMTEAEAGQFHRSFFESYPGFAAWHRSAWAEARDHNVQYATTLLGRRVELAPVAGERAWPRFAKLVNHPVQGSAGDGIKQAMLELDVALAAYDAHLVLMVHDELVVECPAPHAPVVRELLVRTMAAAMDKTSGAQGLFPVDATIGSSWADK